MEKQTVRRYNAKCKACGSKKSVLAAHTSKMQTFEGLPHHYEVFLGVNGESYPGAVIGGWDKLWLKCSCGKYAMASTVIGKYVPGKSCDGRCLSGTGRTCECSCGGKNHGAGNA